MFSTRVWRPDLNVELDMASPNSTRARKTAPTASRTIGERPRTLDPGGLALTTSSVGPVIGVFEALVEVAVARGTPSPKSTRAVVENFAPPATPETLMFCTAVTPGGRGIE